MNAIVLRDVRQPVELIEMPHRKAGPGEVVVQLKAAALNHRDVYVQQGLYPGIKLPVILGSDGAGVVTEVGEGVNSQWLGKAVVINPGLNWGSNAKFYSPDFRILGMPDDGTFAEYIRINAQYIYPKPDYLSFEEASTIPLGGVTAWRALMTRGRLQAGDRVLITGIGGGVALLAMQIAVAAGAEVWVTSGSEEKLQRAVTLGAKGGVDYKEPDWAKTLLAKTGGGKAGYFDVIIDSAGGPGFAKLLEVAASGGRIVIYGGTTGNLTDLLAPRIFFKHLDILGSTMGTGEEFAAMLQFVEAHQLKPVIDTVYPLAETEAALRKMASGAQFGKLVLSIP
ncbi:zinc-binding dehydrogenase [Nibrella saemangeumensis]|uniref:Zinc-binding dehydrogenase n=1 Tax=Nibrella saemangeumensis TaxID=1084526 RepID=A0ABP8MHI1_9BACT